MRFISLHPEAVGKDALPENEAITKTDFFNAGLSGCSNSAAVRDAVAKEVGLPEKMSANALLAALNLIITKKVFNDICGKLIKKEVH